MKPWFTMHFFDIGHSCYDHLTPVKTGQHIIWNNKDIRINNKSVFYKNFFESDIIYVNDLLFALHNIDSYVILNIINKTNFLVWAGLRHAIPSHLKTNTNPVLEISHSLKINNMVFDVLERHQNIITLCSAQSTKAKFPNNAQVLKRDFNLNEEQFKKSVYLASHSELWTLRESLPVQGAKFYIIH